MTKSNKTTLENKITMLQMFSKKYDVQKKFKGLDSELYHFVHPELMISGKLPSIPKGKEKTIFVNQDSDIKVAKGEKGGHSIESIYHHFTEQAGLFTAEKESSLTTEREKNFVQEASNFIRFCIEQGHATETEIDSMISMSIGNKQHDEYLLANGKYHVDINAYALVRIYGTNMAKVSRDINVKMEIAREYLEDTSKKETVEDKSDRWLFDKLRHQMPETWVHEVAQLFSMKEMLTEQYITKANSLTIGDSEYKFALTAAALYYTVAKREFAREDKHIEKMVENPYLEEYTFSGISSVFSLFALGTADFLYRYRALSNHIMEVNSKPIAINTTAVIIKFDKEMKEQITAYYNETNGMLDSTIKFIKEGDRIKFATNMYVENEAVNGSFFQNTGKQLLGEKELDNLADGPRKEAILKEYKDVQFKKNGIFTMNHEKYEGTVIHSKLYNSMIKIWMINLVGVQSKPLPTNLKEDRISFNDTDDNLFKAESEGSSQKTYNHDPYSSPQQPAYQDAVQVPDEYYEQMYQSHNSYMNY